MEHGRGSLARVSSAPYGESSISGEIESELRGVPKEELTGSAQFHPKRWNQALSFAAVLPPMIRALFIEDWKPEQAVLPFGEPADWLADVRSVRPKHNFSPPDAVASVATALRRHVDTNAFERVLALLPVEASRYWQPKVLPSAELAPITA